MAAPVAARDIRGTNDPVIENDTAYTLRASPGQIVTIVFSIDPKSGRTWSFTSPRYMIPLGPARIENGNAILRVSMAGKGYASLTAIYRKAGDEAVPFTPNQFGGPSARTRYITFRVD